MCSDPESSPRLYLRYIDGVFAILDDDQLCIEFLEKLNTRHPNNDKLTVEQAKSTIPLLDIEIKINSDKFDVWKLSNTGLWLSFNAFRPKIWKNIICLLNRAKTIYLMDYLFQKVVVHLKNLFTVRLSNFFF